MACLVRIIGSVNSDQIQNLFNLFTSSAKAEMFLCRQHLHDKESADLALMMHKLKSSAHTVGAMRFAHFARRFEEAANQMDWEAMEALLGVLDQALLEVETALLEQFEVGSVLEYKLPDTLGSVLVVADDAKLQRQITVLIQALGITDVLHASTGMAGLQILRERTPNLNLLLCDLDMPNMESVEFLRRVGEIGYQGDIILVSDSDDDRLLHTAVTLAGLLRLHLLGSLSKPVSPDDLLSLLNQPIGNLTKIVKKVAEQDLSPEDILEGLYKNEFDVYFQPKVDAVSLLPIGVEALARWRRQGVIIPADAFIMAAEHYGLISQLSELLLIKTFFGRARLAALGHPLTVSVNLSSHWMLDVNLPEFIQASLHATGLKAEYVILEISESHILNDMAQIQDVMGRLSAKGFKLSIDNFGVRCSSLEKFTRLPLDEIKWDRAFVQRAVDNVSARMILEANVDMANKLNLPSVAEGVETQEELELARELGCTHVQGWFIGKAMPIDELIGWLYLNNGV
jgi:EAL domain-containing protein (putative c-di-GMP-specific phosphodiesterase class I)/HPt (histidine-containing phosphotransfer) domain-containing protein